MKLKAPGIAKVSLLIVFLALIRCIGEFFRLKHSLKNSFTIEQATPFMWGALVTAVAALVMTIFLFYGKYKFMIAIAVLAIGGLVALKIAYTL